MVLWMERLHLWTLEERRNRLDLIEVFKIIKGYSKCEISDFFIMDKLKPRFARFQLECPMPIALRTPSRICPRSGLEFVKVRSS